MKTEQEAKEAWINRASYYLEKDEAFAYLAGKIDFQTVLIEAFEKECNKEFDKPVNKPNDYKDGFSVGILRGLEIAIELIKTVTPKKK